MWISNVKVAALAVGLGVAQSSYAGIMTFTDRVLWEAAVGLGNIVTEDFNGAASDFGANSSGGSVGTQTTVDVIGHVGDSSRQGLNGDGFFEGEVDSSSFETDDGASIRFNTGSIFGFALVNLQDDNSSPSFDLEEIGVLFGGSSFLASDITGDTDSSLGGTVSSVDTFAPFLGFTSTTSELGFSLVHGDQITPVSGSDEEFFIDELLLATSLEEPPSPSQVPAPATLMLLGFGLAAFGVARKKLVI